MTKNLGSNKRIKGTGTRKVETRDRMQKPAEGIFGRRTPPSQQAVRQTVLAGICPWCGRGPFKVLAGHTQRMHGVDRLELREMAGLTYSASICDPETAQRMAERARHRPPPRVMPGSEAVTKPRKLSPAAQALNRQKLIQVRDPEQVSKAFERMRAPESRAKAVAALKARAAAIRDAHEHGTYARYQTGKCRCVECREANATYNRERRKARKAERESER